MYVLNLSPSVPLAGDIPQRVWSGKDVVYKHLKVFGCKAFVHVPRDEISKLDSKTKWCIYLSSPNDEFGSRLWDPIKTKIMRSRDVVFIEDETIQDIGKPEKPKATTPQVLLSCMTIMGEMMMLKIVMMQLNKAVQVRDMMSHLKKMMTAMTVMIIHLIPHHQCSS